MAPRPVLGAQLVALLRTQAASSCRDVFGPFKSSSKIWCSPSRSFTVARTISPPSLGRWFSGAGIRFLTADPISADPVQLEPIVPIPPSVNRRHPELGQVFREVAQVGTGEVVFETGKLARLTSGAVEASVGNTRVLVTAVASHTLDSSRDFLPLQVDYREKSYASGKIPNTFMRREGAPKEREILCSRVIDRSVRPLFPKGFYYDTQISATVLCSDGELDPDVLSINAASAALTISSVPWNGPIGAVRIARVGGKFIVNPNMSQLEECDLNLTYAGTRDKALMIETQAKEISNEDLTAALLLAHSEAVKMIEPQERLAALVAQEKRQLATVSVDPLFMAWVRSRAEPAIESVLTNSAYGKAERGQALSQVEADVVREIKERDEQSLLPQLAIALEQIKREVIRQAVFDKGTRPDGRGLGHVRPLYCEAGLMPELHGSALFSRGNTQVLCSVTMGPPEDAQYLDSLVGPTHKQFMVHYYFPGYSINEVRQERGGLNRREVGHGTLAEKALVGLLPESIDFPYSVRITAQTLASDGSSSMATICAASMALMDAGIKVKRHAAGVSIGLIATLHPDTNEIQDYRLLTDILGLEDYLGEMDFKIAGTRQGVTAIQLDMKLPGVPLSILCEALLPALTARCQILTAMDEEISDSRLEQRDYSPRIGTVQLEKENIGRLIGPLGANIKLIQRTTGARVSVDEDGKVNIFARDLDTFEAAKEMVESSAGKEIQVGQTYTGKVVAVKEFGAFVELEGGVQGLLHVSELTHDFVVNVEDVVTQGEMVTVACIGRDFRGNIKLSKKALLPKELPSPPHSPSQTPPMHRPQSTHPAASAIEPQVSRQAWTPRGYDTVGKSTPGRWAGAGGGFPSSGESLAGKEGLKAGPARPQFRWPGSAARPEIGPAATAAGTVRPGGTNAEEPIFRRMQRERRERAVGVSPNNSGRMGASVNSTHAADASQQSKSGTPPWSWGPTWHEEVTPKSRSSVPNLSSTSPRSAAKADGMESPDTQHGRWSHEGEEAPDVLEGKASGGVQLREGEIYEVEVKEVRRFGAAVEVKEVRGIGAPVETHSILGLLRFDEKGEVDASCVGLEPGQRLQAMCVEAQRGSRPKFSLAV